MIVRRRGFSLLEAIVSVAIAVALLGALAVFTTNLSEARQRLAQLTDRLECADAVFQLCDKAFATAVVDDGQLGAGISGSESSLRIVSSHIGTGGEGGSLLGDRESHTIEFDASARRVIIVHGEHRDVLATAVRSLRVRYLTSDGWVDSFDSAEHGIFPVGVELSMWFERAGEVAKETELDSSETALMAAADRTRFFRVMGAPHVDVLARRAILDGEQR